MGGNLVRREKSSQPDRGARTPVEARTPTFVAAIVATVATRMDATAMVVGTAVVADQADMEGRGSRMLGVGAVGGREREKDGIERRARGSMCWQEPEWLLLHCMHGETDLYGHW